LSEELEDEVFVDSAGTGAWHVGSPPDERALRTASLRGADISPQRAHRIDTEHCENFDFILTLDEENYRAVAGLCRRNAEVRPFLDFATGSPETAAPNPTTAAWRASSASSISSRRPRRDP
jgi:protein-tyrosine phosphatase